MNDVIYDAIAEVVKQQPWYKKNANTIVAGIGALAAILSFVLTLSLGLPEQAVAAIGGGISVLTTLAVKFTKNGYQPSMADKLAVAASDPIVAAERDRSGPVGRHRAR